MGRAARGMRHNILAHDAFDREPASTRCVEAAYQAARGASLAAREAYQVTREPYFSVGKLTKWRGKLLCRLGKLTKSPGNLIFPLGSLPSGEGSFSAG